MAMKIGVLALQGAFIEHIKILESLGVQAVEVRKPEQLRDLDGLIIPGGESTTFGKLATEFGLMEPLRELCASGKPVWGTCAGMIFLAKEVGRPQPLLGVMDVEVKRNAFGRQVQSFEQDLSIPELPEPDRPFHAIFIRAPLVDKVGQDVRVLARLEDGAVVAAQQANLLATAFHPELTRDTRFHQYFIEQIKRKKKQ